MNELPDGSVNKIRVEKAIWLAAVGVTFHDFDPAHYTALAVRAVWPKALDNAGWPRFSIRPE